MTTEIFKPILYSPPMVQANLDNRKSQTRRVCKINPAAKLTGVYTRRRLWDRNIEECPNPLGHFAKFDLNGVEIEVKSKFTEGNILWVRERFIKCGDSYVYATDKNTGGLSWKPSIHMPKEAARIFHKVTNVRCERLQDISEADAISEGVIQHSDYGSTGYIHYGRRDEALTDIDAIWSFETLWDSINAKKHPWESNPWVWVYEFERIEKPENFK